ncbi:putative reverse transcriptase domain-containing protein [Tanacetum coccineum]
MMTAEYCPRTEIQKIEQELWTLSMKGDDIDGYTDRFHELAVMCPTLVTPEYKKIERYVWGLPERIQGNVTSSKPANVHEAICMARELVDQSVRAKATRITESKTEDRKLREPMLLPQLRVEVMLGTYHFATSASCTIMVCALPSAENVRELVIKKRTVELGLQQQVATPNRM